MSKKLSSFLVAILATVAFGAVAAVSQAELRFSLNGKLAGNVHENVTQWGTLTMKSPFWGEITCKVILGAPVWNEATEGRPERGIAAYEGWEPFVCHATRLKGKTFITAETAVQLIERENTHHEKVYEAKRGAPTMPWPTEPRTTPEATTVFHMGNTEKLPVEPMKIIVNAPEELFEVPYAGTLAPRWINGTKNGLKPTRIEFEGESGKTGFLITPDICGGNCSMANLYLKGELSLLGAKQQLVTVE